MKRVLPQIKFGVRHLLPLKRLTPFVLLMFLAPAAVFAGTCALCREALQSGGSPGLIQGFYWSILLIASVPLIIMAIASRFIWRAWRVSLNSPKRLPPQS